MIVTIMKALRLHLISNFANFTRFVFVCFSVSVFVCLFLEKLAELKLKYFDSQASIHSTSLSP